MRVFAAYRPATLPPPTVLLADPQAQRRTSAGAGTSRPAR